MAVALIVLAAIALVALLAVVSGYNRLVQLRNRTDQAWAQIDVQLKRRYDLIPSLVEAVKGYAAHERTTLQAVTDARRMAVDAGTPTEQARAEETLTSALKSLFAVGEAYPALRASENFLALERDLQDAENRIAYARQYYNDAVVTLNTNIQRVPSYLIARLFGFKARAYFDADEASSGAVAVRF